MSDGKNEGKAILIIKKISLIILALAFVGIVIWVIVRGGGEEEVKNREYDEAEVAIAARELIEKSEILTELYFGDGIPYLTEGEFSSNYCPADTEYLDSIGVKYIEDLKNLTRGVFSEGESEFLFSLFLSRMDNDEFVGVAHYIPAYEGEGDEKKEVGILVYKKRAESVLVKEDESTTHDYDTISVIGSEGERVKVSIKSTVVCDDGRKETQDNEIYLIEENGVWKLDSQPKCAYIGISNQ